MKRRPFSSIFWWVLFGSLWALAIVIGVTGWVQYSTLHHSTFDFFDDLYLTIQLISFSSGAVEKPVPLILNFARFFLPFLTLLTAIKAFLDVFQEQIRVIRMRSLRNHVIICGLSRKGMLLAAKFRQQGDDVVVIEQDDDNQWLESCRGLGIFVIVGDASDPTILNLAGLVHARGLIAVCDNDGINADILVQVQALASERTPRSKAQPLKALAHITDPQLCELLRLKGAAEKDQAFHMELFNAYERAATQLLSKYPVWSEDQVRSGHEPHILLIGLGWMGENIITHAVQDWQTHRLNPKTPLHMTVIDRRAAVKAASFAVRYPHLTEDCQITPLQMEVHSPEFERGEFLVDGNGATLVDRVYVCFDDDALGLQAGLMLHRLVPQNNALMIIIRMAEENGLSKLLEDRKNHHGVYQNLIAFGYLNHICTPDLLK